MFKSKINKTIIFNIFIIFIAFCFVVNYMKYEILQGHCRDFVFNELSALFEMGRAISVTLLYFFYNVLPELSTDITLNDLQCGAIAYFKGFVIALLVFFYAKIFFISFFQKNCLSNKFFSILYVLILFLIFNDYSFDMKSFMSVFDSAVFFDYSLSTLFYASFFVFIAEVYINDSRLSKKKFIFLLILAFLVSLSNEFCSVASFASLLFLLFVSLFKNNLISSFSSYISKNKYILSSFFVIVLGMICYFSFSNYSDLQFVGGGHIIDWFEQFVLVKQNFIPFLQSYYKFIFLPLVSLFIVIIFSLVTLYLAKVENFKKIFTFSLSLLFGLFCVNMIFLFIGQTALSGGFYFEHKPIKVSNAQFLIFISFFLLGFIVNAFINKNFNRVFLYLLVSLHLCSFLYMTYELVGFNYFKKYFKYIETTKNLRQVQFLADKMIVITNSYLGLSLSSSDVYKTGMFWILYNNMNAATIHQMNKLLQDEYHSGLSRLFIFDEEFAELDNFSDNESFDYYKNVYNLKPNALIFADLKYVNNAIFPEKISIEKIMNKKVSFKEIKQKKFTLEELNELISKYPKAYNLYLARANYYNKNKQFELAEKDYDMAVKYQDDLLLAQYMRGLFYRKNGEYLKAEEDLKLVAKRHPYSLLMKDFLAKLMIRNKHYEDAIDMYSNLISIFPYGNSHSYTDFYFRRAEIYFNTGDYLSALSDYQMSEKKNEYSFLFHINYKIAKTLRQLGDIDEAIENYDIELSYNPDNYIAYLERGECFMMIQSYDKAIDDFISFLETDFKINVVELKAIIDRLELMDDKIIFSDVDQDKKEKLRALLDAKKEELFN